MKQLMIIHQLIKVPTWEKDRAVKHRYIHKILGSRTCPFSDKVLKQLSPMPDFLYKSLGMGFFLGLRKVLHPENTNLLEQLRSGARTVSAPHPRGGHDGGLCVVDVANRRFLIKGKRLKSHCMFLVRASQTKPHYLLRWTHKGFFTHKKASSVL